MTMEKVKGELITSVALGDWDAFVTLIGSSQDHDIKEAINVIEKKDLEQIWQRIHSKCAEILLQPDPHDGYKIIKAVSLLALKTNSSQLDGQNFFDTISLLSNTLLEMNRCNSSLHDVDQEEEEEAIRDLVSLVCETAWKEKVPGMEELMPAVVRRLLVGCLSSNRKATCMTRLHSVRECIPAVADCDGRDDDDDDGDDNVKLAIRGMLLEAVGSGSFLKNDKGRKVMAVVFCLGPAFARDTHRILKNAILTASKSSLALISQVYFWAWKNARDRNHGRLIECLEMDCIGDLIHTALHSQRSAGFNSQFVRFFKVLSYFHNEKKSMNVASMLHDLYSGILFRSLKAPNGTVRANAVFLLADVFPLCNPDAGREFNDRLLNMQLKVMEESMNDDNIKVRQAAVAGLFGMLSNYWEVFPVDKTRTFLGRMISRSVRDASSSEIRLCVVRGFTVLLENCLAYPCLKGILPLLKDTVHDLNERVRSAMVDLLQKVKGIGDLKFWQVVPMEHLLARLEAEESPRVVEKLVLLLAETYAPPSAVLASRLDRCVRMFSANGKAARRFHLHLAYSLDVAVGCKFIVYILEKLTTQIQSYDVSNASSHSDDMEVGDASAARPEGETSGNGSRVSNSFSLADASVVTNLCEVVLILLVGMKKALSLPQNEKAAKFLAKQMSRLVPKIIRFYQDVSSITDPLMLACSRYSPKIFPTLTGSVVSRLSSMPEPPWEDLEGQECRPFGEVASGPHASIDVLLEVACRWKKVGEILTLASNWMSTVFDDIQSEKRRKKPMGVKFGKPDETKPALGLLAVGRLLRCRTCRSLVFADEGHREHIRKFSSDLGAVKITIENSLISKKDIPAGLLAEILRIHLVIEALLHDKASDDNFHKFLSDLYGWCAGLITGWDAEPQSNRKRKNNSELFGGVLEITTKMTNDFLVLDLLGPALIPTAVNLCSAILKSNHSFAPKVTSRLISNIIDVTSTLADMQDQSGTEYFLSSVKDVLERLLLLSADRNIFDELRAKAMTLILKVQELCNKKINDSDCETDEDGDLGPTSVIDVILSLVVRSSAEVFRQGRIIQAGNHVEGVGYDDGDDDRVNGNKSKDHQSTPFLDFILTVLANKRAKPSIFLTRLLDLCRKLNTQESVEDLAGALVCLIRLSQIEKCRGDLLERCCRSLISRCTEDSIGDNRSDGGAVGPIMIWLDNQLRWIAENILNRT